MKLAICIPNTWPYVHRAFFQSMMAMMMSDNLESLRELGIYETVQLISPQFPIDFNRNNLAREAMKRGADMLVWFDGDMTFPPDTLQRLVKNCIGTAGGIVSGTYFKKGPPYECISAIAHKGYRTSVSNVYQNIDPTKGDADLVECDLIGMGCAITPVKVFKELKSPWFGYKINEITGEQSVSEDVLFCEKARFGDRFKIYTDTSLVCGHIVEDHVSIQHWRTTHDEENNQKENG